MASPPSAKERAIESIRNLPDDVSLEDVIARLAFIQAVEEGLRQSEAGRVVPHEEIERQFLR
jgi:predicted transcriptional regulator